MYKNEEIIKHIFLVLFCWNNILRRGPSWFYAINNPPFAKSSVSAQLKDCNFNYWSMNKWDESMSYEGETLLFFNISLLNQETNNL